jgi:hypothetical protein
MPEHHSHTPNTLDGHLNALEVNMADAMRSIGWLMRAGVWNPTQKQELEKLHFDLATLKAHKYRLRESVLEGIERDHHAAE